MKTYEEMAESVASRVKAEKKKRSHIRNAVIAGAVPLCLFAVIAGINVFNDRQQMTVVDTGDVHFTDGSSAVSQVANSITDTLPVTSAPDGSGGSEAVIVEGSGIANGKITDTLPVTSPPPYTDDNGAPIGEGGEVGTVGNADTTAPADGELPKITSVFESGTMGFEGYLAYDISELDDNNPWNRDMKLDTMPVYKGMAYKFGSGVTFCYDENTLEFRARYLAQILGTSITETVNKEYVGDFSGREAESDIIEKNREMPYCIKYACADGTRLTVEGDGTVKIKFTPARELPADVDASDHAAVEQYIFREYAPIFMDDPGNREVYDRNIYGERNMDRFTLFRKSQGDVESIIDYNFGTVSVCLDEDSRVWIIWVNSEPCEKIGDYPIITADEAEKLLLDGKYIASLHLDRVDKEHIEKVELIYRTSHRDTYYQPYYRFYVRLDSSNIDPVLLIDDPKLKDYAALYVPAVNAEYLSDVELWDGTFN